MNEASNPLFGDGGTSVPSEPESVEDAVEEVSAEADAPVTVVEHDQVEVDSEVEESSEPAPAPTRSYRGICVTDGVNVTCGAYYVDYDTEGNERATHFGNLVVANSQWDEICCDALSEFTMVCKGDIQSPFAL